jgi:hypothetical protein
MGTACYRKGILWDFEAREISLSDQKHAIKQRKKWSFSHASNSFVIKYREKCVVVINAVTQKHIKGEFYFFYSRECITRNLKQKWDFPEISVQTEY